MSLICQKHGPHMTLLIGSSHIIMIVSNNASYQNLRCLTSILTDVFNFVTNSVTQSVTKSVTGPRCSAPLLARDSPFIVEIGH